MVFHHSALCVCIPRTGFPFLLSTRIIARTQDTSAHSRKLVPSECRRDELQAARERVQCRRELARLCHGEYSTFGSVHVELAECRKASVLLISCCSAGPLLHAIATKASCSLLYSTSNQLRLTAYQLGLQRLVPKRSQLRLYRRSCISSA